MANANLTDERNNNQPLVLEYSLLIWGDLIYGTKEQLQNIGIGEGVPYPGEDGGPKRTLKVIEPRGFNTNIQKSFYMGEGIYRASIHFPGRERINQYKSEYAKGVIKDDEYSGFDKYIGTADALIKAGLILKDQLPGMPGMRKVRVSILPDGTLPLGISYEQRKKGSEAGAKLITKVSKTLYSVRIYLDKDAEEQRSQKRIQENQEWEGQMKALPRPAPLIDIKPSHTPYSDPKDSREYFSTIARFVETAFKDRNFEYTAESSARISNAIAELKQAIVCSDVASIPKYQRNANVLIVDFRNGRNKDGRIEYI